MAETTPLLDTQFLQSTFAKNVPVDPITLPNIPFRTPNTPLPTVDGAPTPSALSAIENSVLTIPKDNGALTGGSIPRSLLESTSRRYDTLVPGDYNNEDAYAQGQGWPSKMVNGVGKGLLLTGTTLLQTTVGTLNGVARFIETGRAASFYDNEFNRQLDELNKVSEDYLPNYYTDVEKNAAWYSPDKLLSANFLWDGIVKNLGFAAGAAISGGLIAGGLRALPLTARLFSIGKAAETLAATEEALLSAGKVAETYGKVKSLSDKFLASYQLMNPAGRALVGALATTGEAGFEAFHNLNQFRDQKIQEWRDSHGGIDPKGADLDAINSEADGVGNSSFWLNTALLSATNYIQFPKILGSSYTVEKGMINSLKNDIYGLTKDASGAFIRKEATGRAGRVLSTLNKIRPYTFSTSEAFEEGAQYAISVGTQDYYNKKYNGEVADFLESTLHGIKQTLGTNEGMENVLIGGLSGALMLGRGRFLESAQKSKNTAAAIQQFNKWQLSDFTRDTVDSVNRGTVLQEEREAFLRQGNILESKERETDYIINYLTPRIKYGRFDLVQTDIAEYKQLASTDQGFAQLQSEGKALPGDTREAYLQRLANLEVTATNIHSLYQSLNLRYGNLVDSNNDPAYPQEVMDKMIYAATKVADYDHRIPELTAQLASQGILISSSFTSNVSEGGTSEYNKSLNEIEKLNILSDQKDTAKQNLKDLKELVRRRQLFMKEYDQIKKNPGKFTNAATQQAEAEEAAKPTIVPEREYETEDIEKAVVHQLSDDDWQVKAGNTVINNFPTKEEAEAERDNFNINQQGSKKVRVIEVNDDGSAKVEDSNGNITQLSKAEMEKYEIIETEEERKSREEKEKIEKQEAIKKDLLDSEDKGISTTQSSTDYEPQYKKSNITVVTSSKAATKSGLPHHVRANTFGANLYNLHDSDSIRAVIVTSKNEHQIIPGLTKFLKGDSDVDPSKIVALVMVRNGKPVGMDGKVLDNPSTENAIFQVMPDPKLEWSKEFGGGSMFRKETTPEQIEYYKKQYSEWINSVLENPAVQEYNFEASFGIPQYVTFPDEKGDQQRDYNAVVSVKDAGLIKSSDLVESPLIKVATLDVMDKGSTLYTDASGRVFLSLPNGYLPLQNRKLTKDEVSTIYEAIHQLSIDVFENGNARSEKSKRLLNWLKSVVYWGTPKDSTGKKKAPGYNSIFFDNVITPEGEDFRLFVGKSDSYEFTPTSIEKNKAAIISVLEGLYNNVNSTMVSKDTVWNQPYEEITKIGPKGAIESKQWKNYQTYLLSQEGRKPEELPLFVQMKPVKEGETNRTGIYYTIKETADRFSAPPTKKEVKPVFKPKGDSAVQDIEKRRKQELEFNFGRNVELISSKRKPVISRQIIYSEKYKSGTRIFSSVEEGDAYAQTLIDDYDKINAKYDAELAALNAPSTGTYVLDGKTKNTYTSPTGKKIVFIATPKGEITVLREGDVDEVLKTLTASMGEEKAKANIKGTIRVAIQSQIQPASKQTSLDIEDEEEEMTEGAKKLFGKGKTTPKEEIKKENVVGQVFPFNVGENESGEPYEQRVRIDSIEQVSDDNYRVTATNRVNGKKYDMIINEGGQVQSYTREGKTYKGSINDEIVFPASAEFGGTKAKKETSAPKSIFKPKVSKEEEDMMKLQIDDLDDDTPLRVKLEEQIGEFEGENWTKVEQWLKANFPLLPVYRVKNILKATNGAQAWGMLKDSAIYVYENAEVGTIYHEVFEGVWKIFTPNSEQVSIINEFKARKGSFTDRPTGKTIQYSNATDQQIKEQLAEEFRDYVLYKKTPVKPVDGRPFIVKLFSDLVNLIKTFFTGPQTDTNTEKLFEKIGTGYFKQYTPTSQLSFARKGIIDIEEAYADAFTEFRVKNIPANVLNDIIQQMTYITLRDTIKDNKSLFNLPKINRTELYKKLKADLQKTALKSRKEAQELVKQGKVTQAQADPVIEQSKALWKSITDEWDEIQKKHEEYLRVYSIEFDENDDVILKDEDKSNKSFEQDATKIDNFKKANSAIKLLLSTVPRVTSDGKLVHSSINGASLLPTSEVFMALMNRVHTARNIDEMMDRIKEMSEEDSNYKTLYNRLTKNSPDLSKIATVHDAQLLAAFWRTFKKQSPDVKNVYIFENGDVEVGDSNLASAARQVSADYANAIVKTVKGTNPYFEYSQKEKAYIGKPSGVKNVKLDNDTNRIAFLKSLGIEFKPEELKKLSGDKLTIFREATAGIKESIVKAEKIATISRKVLNIKGRLMQLSLIRASIDNPEFDSTFFNVKGERTQTFIGTNPGSDLYDYLSQVSNIRELENTPFSYLLPNMDVFSKHSNILSRMFNPETGNRIKGGEQLMKVGYADGTVNTENGKKKQSAKLTYKERLIQEINLNLKGYYYNLVPGDSSMEWMTYMGNPVSPDSLLSGYGNVFDIFKGYFMSEIELSREDRVVAKDRNNKDLRFFKPILGDDLHNKIIKEKGSPEAIYNNYKGQIDTAVQKYIEKNASDFRNLLSQYDIIKPSEEGFIAENLAFTQGDSITEAVLNRNMNALSVNFIINNIEQHKLLYSDPYQYSDELKRIKNANSPRQAIINNSPAMNAALNTIWNEGYNSDDIGYTDMTRDYFRTITLSDVVSTSDLKDYGTFEETDGGGIISMKAYRWFRIKAGEWNEDEERQYKYDIAYEKRAKELPISKSEQELLDNKDELIRKGLLGIKSAYTPLKPIVFGNKSNGQEFNSIVLDKFALYPISYRIAHEINPESNAIKHYNKMQRENIDYSVFASGRKVGNEGTNGLYNGDGSFNQLPYKALVNIPHSIISIQSEVPSKDEPIVSRGSQITKLATMDFMEAGVPIDFGTGAFKQRFDAWNALSESQKEEQSPLYKEMKNNQTLLEAITQEGYRSLLNRMGIQEVDGDFVITDPTKIANTLEEEILKREVNDNIKDAFEGFKAGDVVLEATPAYQQIRNILYSLADKNVISPKISGGQKVQIPSTLLESVRAKEEKGAYTSDVLRFYKDEDGKRTCEIMVGRWFQSDLSDDELLTYLNKTKSGQEILAGIAYRIPTQKQNSIDSFVIKQFLPTEFGDSVIIPSALVKKVGSDFDIDKLFIYFKNIYRDEKNNIKILPFYGYGQKAIEKFKDLFLGIKDLKIADTSGKLVQQTNLSNLFGDIALGLKEGKVADKWTPIFQEWFKDELVDGRLPVQKIEEIFMSRIERLNKTLDTLTNDDIQEALSTEMAERWYKESLQNEYIQSLQNLVSHPLNFENLIKPNSADQLKDLAKEITKLTGFGEFDYRSTTNLLNRHFMSRLRHAFVSGKYAIGIAAVNQTNHSLNQRQPIYIDQSRWDLLSTEDKVWLTGGTMNPKDVTVKFRNFNKMDIDGKIVPTLSMIKNAKGENISDIIGQFIDGYVDISKGPWIMELGAAPNVAGVWLFLTKIGVPINDVAYFMNQPIIRDYLRSIENAGYSWLFIDSFVENIKLDANYEVDFAQVKNIKEIPANLKSTVGKKNLSTKERAEQHFILDEFLKYAKMANHMFLVTQGSNWDTATFNDPYLVFKKQEQIKKANATIISSVEDLMKNSFIGKLSETVYNIRDAFSTVLVSDRSNVRDVIQDVLRPYVDMSDRDFVKLAQKAVNNLFDWAVQIDRNLNTQVTNILLSDQNTAKQMSDFVVSVRKDEKHPLYNNLIIKLVTPHFSEKEGGVNNLKIKNKDNKVYDQNQMIYAFSELKEYLKGQDNPLYGSLVRLAVLQSGLTNSPISFTSLLPYEDFKLIYNQTLSILETIPNLENFKEMDVFQRNNWSDDDLVPTRRARWKQNKNGEWKYNGNMNFWSTKRVERAIRKGEIPQLLKINTKARESDFDIIVYTWETGTKSQKAEMKKKGDFSYIHKGLFKKVYQGNEPLTQSYTIGETIITDIIYKPINAWGDSHSADGIYFGANEFYASPRQSVIDNGFMKIEKEIADETVITYFTEPAPKSTKTKGTDQIPPCI